MQPTLKINTDHFPALKDTFYANTAAAGVWPTAVFEWRKKQEQALFNKASLNFTDGLNHIAATKKGIGELLKASAEQIALVPNFSWGLNTVLPILPKSAKVLLVEDEYPSVVWPFSTHDFDCCWVTQGPNLEERIAEKIRTESIDVLAISLTNWLNGAVVSPLFTQELKALYPNLLIIADGTQYCGMYDLDFNTSGIDVLIASGYKWLLAGYGNGFIVFSDTVINNYTPKTIGFGSANGNIQGRHAISFTKHFEPGHLDALAFGTIGASLGYINEIGFQRIVQKNQELSIYALEISSGAWSFR